MFKIADLIRLGALSLIVTVAAPVLPAAQRPLPADEVAALLENAQTKAGHLKLAEHYAAEAERFRSEARSHEAMAARFQRPALPPKAGIQHPGMANHCRKLAQSLKNAAKESEQLAKMHEAMAAGAEQ